LDAALDCHYIDEAAMRSLNGQYHHIEAQLRLMIDGAAKWCGEGQRSEKDGE
jgi:hypothetical protein